MKTLDQIIEKYNLNPEAKMPIEIPNVGRDDLAALFAELGFKEGAEVGVEAGAYSEVLCRSNPGLKLHCIDLWEGYEGYKESDKNMESNYEKARQVLAPYDCVFLREYSDQAVRGFDDESLDFVYIDCNHDLLHVIEDITLWIKKVKKGGIIAGHDYCDKRFRRHEERIKNTTHHVIPAVNAYTTSYSVSPWFILGRKEKIEGEIRDRNRSWMWVKS